MAADLVSRFGQLDTPIKHTRMAADLVSRFGQLDTPIKHTRMAADLVSRWFGRSRDNSVESPARVSRFSELAAGRSSGVKKNPVQ